MSGHDLEVKRLKVKSQCQVTCNLAAEESYVDNRRPYCRDVLSIRSTLFTRTSTSKCCSISWLVRNYVLLCDRNFTLIITPVTQNSHVSAHACMK